MRRRRDASKEARDLAKVEDEVEQLQAGEELARPDLLGPPAAKERLDVLPLDRQRAAREHQLGIP